VQDVLARLEGVKQSGEGQYMARCPAHDDRHASLSIGRGDDGRALVDCKAGCSAGEVVKALGMKVADLFATPSSAPSARPAPKAKHTSHSAKCGRTIYKTAEDALAAAGRMAKGEFVAAWAYPGDTFRVGRFALANGAKTFRPIHRNGAGWSIGDPAGPLPLYLSDTIGDAGLVVVVEGEKCADAAASVGLVAVTSAHGGGSAHKSDWQALAGREVVILPDNDDTGRKYAQEVATILNKLTPPASVKIVELPGLGDGGDIADWIDADGPMGCQEADTIKAAVLELAKTAKPWTPPAAKSIEGEPVITTLADVTPRPVEWLWPSRIALGKLTLVVGDPGLGKSFITLDLAGRVSKGTAWPDCPQARRAPGGVVLLSAEDDLADTIRPRLDAAGADVSRIAAITTVKRYDLEKRKDVFEPFNLTDHLPALERAITQVGDCRLVVIDPVSAYLGGTDSHKNADIRGLLMPLSELAARHGVALVAVTHLRKGEGPAMYRAMGSLAFIAAARAAYCVTRDKGDETGQRRFFLPVKNNLGNDRDGLAYCLDDLYSVNGQPVVKWEATLVAISADEALADDRRRGGEDDTSELEEAKTWLADVLAAGPLPAKDILAQARQDGISKRTLDRAKKSLNVTTAKAQGVANGGWSWSLGEGCQAARQGNLGDVGNLGNLPEKPRETALFEGPEIEGCQERQDGQGCQSAPEAPVSPRPAANLDGDTPGPTDLLTPEQYATYKAVYYSRSASMSPAEKHARAWKAALRKGNHEAQN
jgi:hypothetical protein